VQTLEDEELPQVDLKGHTVEELAAAANVTVDVIQAAIKMRQKQLLLEKRNYANGHKQKISTRVTVQPTTAATTTTTIRTTTTTRATTTPYIKKKVSRHRIAGGHKVREKTLLILKEF
jgi:hypothetical protein